MKFNMKKVLTLVLLIAVSTTAFSQTTKRQHKIAKNLGSVEQTLYNYMDRDDCDTFFNLCADDTLALYSCTCDGVTFGGYVAGHNCYADKAKADYFYRGGTSLTGAVLYIGWATSVNSTDKFNVRAWDDDGLFYDGSAGAPGTILGTKTVTYLAAETDVTNLALTYVDFTTPIAIPADSLFYVGIDFAYKPGDTVALVTTLDRLSGTCAGINTAVEKWSDNSWYDYFSSWGLSTSHMIAPITTGCESAGCTVSVTPSEASICKKKNTTLTASGADTYTWSPADGLNTTTGASVVASPTVTTTYTVTGTTSGGATCSTTVTVTVLPLPKVTISPNGGTVCLSTSPVLSVTVTGTTGNTFKWYKDNSVISGATTSSYTPTATGEYYCKVTSGDGCVKKSKKVIVDACKLGETTPAFDVEASPNPFLSSINLEVNASGNVHILVTDITGRVVEEIQNADAGELIEIGNNYNAGVYMVTVNDGKNESVIRIVKE
jgi:hypothetical protein